MYCEPFINLANEGYGENLDCQNVIDFELEEKYEGDFHCDIYGEESFEADWRVFDSSIQHLCNDSNLIITDGGEEYVFFYAQSVNVSDEYDISFYLKPKNDKSLRQRASAKRPLYFN